MSHYSHDAAVHIKQFAKHVGFTQINKHKNTITVFAV